MKRWKFSFARRIRGRKGLSFDLLPVGRRVLEECVVEKER